MSAIRAILFTILITCGLSGLNPVTGQIKTSVTYSNPWLAKAKQVNEDRKRFKKEWKQQKKKGKEEYHGARDAIAGSIPLNVFNYDSVPAEDLIAISTLRRAKITYLDLVDSLLNDAETNEVDHYLSIQLYGEKIDSCQLVLDAYSNKYLGSPAATLKLPDSLSARALAFDSTLLARARRDSLIQIRIEGYINSYARSIDEFNQLSMQESQLSQVQQKLQFYELNTNKYRDSKDLKSHLENVSKQELLQRNEKLNEAHQKMAEQKRKYLTLPSSADLEQGVKHSSLEHLPFWERFKIGGNLRVSVNRQVDIDFSPSVAYMLNKKWSVGSEFVIRSQFREGKRWYKSFGSDTYGGRVFVDYSVIKNFFAHAEYEQIYKPELLSVSENPTKIVVPGALAGVGKTFDLSKNVKGKVILQYNFIYDETRAVYPGPWVVRFGFEINRNSKNEIKKD
ncbi:MAG: hypothetical protein RIA62_06470 [Cyclobacteriaceae bacterium]